MMQTTAHPPPPPPPPQAPPPGAAPRPPSLFKKSIEADEYLSLSAFKLYTYFFDGLSDFVDQQAEVVTLRLAVQEKRVKLRQLREEVSESDMAFIDHVRNAMASDAPLHSAELIGLFEATQSARDLVGPSEAEYEPLELSLGAAEHRLAEKYADLETRFEQFFKLSAIPDQEVPTNILYESSSSDSSLSNNVEKQLPEPRDSAPFHGAYIGEQVAIGQVPIPVESSPTETIQLGQGGVRRVGRLTMSSDMHDHSEHAPSSAAAEEKAHDEILADLVGITGAEALLGIVGAEDDEVTGTIEIEARDRRLSRALQGLASENLFHTISDPGPFPEELPGGVDLHGGDTLLLLDETSDTRSRLSDYLLTFESTRDRVNQWMLHHLRVSHRAIHALQRQVIDHASGVPDWATLALSQWSYDGLGYGELYHYGSVDGDSDFQEVVQQPIRPYTDFDPLAVSAAGDEAAGLLSRIAAARTVSEIHNIVMTDPLSDEEQHPSGFYGVNRLIDALQQQLRGPGTFTLTQSALVNT